ncbi:MAG: DUF2461 domain-containing protein [Clostridia bacterium]|nr:DUF2461 domain-containing protein [Clostridia bacterium]
MFEGFREETIQFFLDLRFHNDSAFFHAEHDRYVRDVQTPFYEFITDMLPLLQAIDSQMESRPNRVLSRIHRDTRFSRDKSPYRDHLWIWFHRAAEPRQNSVGYWFELGPQGVGWGMGVWDLTKDMQAAFQRRIAAEPHRVAGIITSCALESRKLIPWNDTYKRMAVPEGVPASLHPWYKARSIGVSRQGTEMKWIYDRSLLGKVGADYQAVAPLYRLLRGVWDDMETEALQAGAGASAAGDEWK